MVSRRGFVSALAGVAALPSFRPDALRRVIELGDTTGAPGDEDYWSEVQRAFDCDRTMVNLNNGGCSPTPTHVLEQMIRDLRFSNELPVIHMWQTLEPRIESVRRDLARAFGCDPEEMAITRNASEANETMILGLDLKRGDEVVVCNQNYGRMLTTWDQRVRREGIVLKQVSVKLPPPSQQYIVDQFRAAVTPRTRVIELTHITNLSGQIFPVREIVSFARPLGIEVLVDGAHAFAQFPFTRDELDCSWRPPSPWTTTSASTRRSAPTPPRTTTPSAWRWRFTTQSAPSGRSPASGTSGTAGPGGLPPRATAAGS
jgi:isopenicillin-N epimerase